MNVLQHWVVALGFVLTVSADAQPVVHLRNLREAKVLVAPIATRGHQVIQFDEVPQAETVAALQQRGVRVLGDVPGNGLLVTFDAMVEVVPMEVRDLGVRYADTLRPEDKISALIGGPRRAEAASEFFIVELHTDADVMAARGTFLNMGLELRESPDLLANHLMIHVVENATAGRTMRTLASLDEVAYIFPASDDLVRGSYVVSCAGALTTNGTVGQLVATYGDGWDGPGKNPTTLSYVFGQMTSKLPAGVPQAEILRAMNEWSKVINLKWNQGTSATATRTINVLFGAGAHGDAYPFDGAGNVLAHTFYPANPNPEPIAGDFHLDDAEAWKVGANIDLFSVALHELGHALGLGHSDNPNDVMYPYYRMTNTLAAGDKAAILSLYAAATEASAATPATPAPANPTPAPAPAPAPSPLTLTVNVPAGSTTAATTALAGTISGGAAASSVTWHSSTGAWGMAAVTGSNWTVSAIALASGANSITITAASGNAQVSQSVSINRQQATTTTTPVSDKTAPGLTITSPGGVSVSTAAVSIRFAGTASDNVGVTKVQWSTNIGGSGIASGTTSWSADIPLMTGKNTVTIRAHDAAGNSSWRSMVITRR